MPSATGTVPSEQTATKRLVVIEDPILNSPFEEPSRHFRFTEEGITNEIVEKRRTSAYFIPVPRPRNRRSREQLVLDTEWTADRLKENTFINKVRARVAQWRASEYAGSPITNTTRQLLDYWKRPDRDRRLFFCQIEALETAIYLAEVAPKWDAWIENDLRTANTAANPELFRIAFKMATGSGKTVVMAMLIAWQALNKFADPYRALDLATPDQREQLEAALCSAANHGFWYGWPIRCRRQLVGYPLRESSSDPR